MIGFLTGTLGVVLGLFVGFYVCLYGGIMQVINAASAHPVQNGSLALGIFRILIAGFATWLICALSVAVGVFLADEL